MEFPTGSHYSTGCPHGVILFVRDIAHGVPHEKDQIMLLTRLQPPRVCPRFSSFRLATLSGPRQSQRTLCATYVYELTPPPRPAIAAQTVDRRRQNLAKRTHEKCWGVYGCAPVFHCTFAENSDKMEDTRTPANLPEHWPVSSSR